MNDTQFLIPGGNDEGTTRKEGLEYLVSQLQEGIKQDSIHSVIIRHRKEGEAQ
ncbi:hypothetical protein P4644_16145 [Priestia aryabhattai]|uniref:hypothetical protein n=1 Tax=Priestia aryabhattai TaxID=412384 RepID=UPI002E1DF19F|nr:hypothetical protein [Priestia aryabhattai]